MKVHQFNIYDTRWNFLANIYSSSNWRFTTEGDYRLEDGSKYSQFFDNMPEKIFVKYMGEAPKEPENRNEAVYQAVSQVVSKMKEDDI